MLNQKKKKLFILIWSIIFILLLAIGWVYYLYIEDYIDFDWLHSTKTHETEQFKSINYKLISIKNPKYNPNDPKSIKWFTIMDRNLWAEEAWSWIGAKKKSYWNHYQWWNNYWFNGLQKEIRTSTRQRNGTRKNTINEFFIEERAMDSIWRYYNVHNWERDKSLNRNLWWWENDSEENNRWLDILDETIKKRQWPCPDWFHIPSIWEWSKLIEFYNEGKWYNAELYEKDGLKEYDSYFSRDHSNMPEWFIKYFNIPFAWDRNEINAELEDQNTLGYYRSSTPWSYYAAFADDMVSTIKEDSGLHSYGMSIRCFSNNYKW